MGEARLKRAGRNRAVSAIRNRTVNDPKIRSGRGSAWLAAFGDLRGMAVTGLVALTGLMSLAHASAATGQSRFASYASEAECVGSHTLSAAICRSAFANARQEYEAKTSSFPSQASCQRRYASCMAWPPDATPGRQTTYRPEWDGVDIVDTPTEQTVTPSPGSTGRAIRFAARPLAAEPQRDLLIRGAAASSRAGSIAAAHPGHPTFAGTPLQRASGPSATERDLPPSAPPPPGSGFTLQDGVLTYPAPQRFQPKNLPRLN